MIPNKLCYEEAINILQNRVINITFPIKEEITLNFIQKSIYPYLPIGWKNDTDIKIALSCILDAIDPTEKKHISEFLIRYTKNQELILEEYSKQEKENIIIPKNKQEKKVSNPDILFFKENIKMLKWVECNNELAISNLNSINILFKKYLTSSDYLIFLKTYTKINSLYNNKIIEEYKSIESYLLYLSKQEKVTKQQEDSLNYRLQRIRADLFNKDSRKSHIQKMEYDIQILLS